MSFPPNTDEQVLIRQLHDLFGIEEETYITTIKVRYIYSNVHPYAKNKTFETLERLITAFKKRRSIDTLNELHRFIQIIRFLNYDTAVGIPQDRSGYIKGRWL